MLQRFEREKIERQHYLAMQPAKKQRHSSVVPPQWDHSIHQRLEMKRSLSNPDITEFWRQGFSSGNLASRFLENENFGDRFSEDDFSLFTLTRNEETRPPYAKAKQKFGRQRNGYHEPLGGKRSSSSGEIDQIGRGYTENIYEPVQQLNEMSQSNENIRTGYVFERNERNRKDSREIMNSNVSIHSGHSSRSSSPRPHSPALYDHLIPRTPKVDDRNRRPSAPVFGYYTQEQQSRPVRTPSPVSRQRSSSLGNHLSKSNNNDSHQRLTNNNYDEVLMRDKPRSQTTDGLYLGHEQRRRKEGYVNVPGIGNENWLVRKKSHSMDSADKRMYLTPPISPATKRPEKRRVSREEPFNNPKLENFAKMNPRIPKYQKSISMESQRTESDYDIPGDALDGMPEIKVQSDPRPKTPEETATEYPETDPIDSFVPVQTDERIDKSGSFGSDEDYLSRTSKLSSLEMRALYQPNEPEKIEGMCASPSIADTSISRLTYNTAMSTIPLTVENRANTEREVQNEEEVCNNVYVTTAKWIGVLLIALLVLFCVTANKICLLVIGYEYGLLTSNATLVQSKNSDGKDRSKTSSKESIVIMLMIIIMVPQGISLFYGIWGKRKSQKWPKKSAVVWIIIGGTIEAACLSFLCLYVLTVLSVEPSLFLLFISGLFVIPTIIQISQSAKKWETKKGKTRIVTFTIAAGMQIVGLILLVYTKNEMIELKAKIAIPITIAILSIAWSPKMRRLQTKPSTQVPKTDNPCERRDSYQDLAYCDDDLGVSVSANVSLESQRNPQKKHSAREKAAIVMSVVHLVMTPVMSIIFCKVFRIAEIEKFSEGFGLISVQHPAFPHFVAQIFVTFIGYHMAWLACSMYAQRPAFALPLTLATPIALTLMQIKDACENKNFLPLKCGESEGEQLYYLIAVAFLMLMGQFLSTGYYVWANMGYIMGTASHLFWLPSYTGVLLEPFLLLNRRNKVTDDAHVASKRLARDTYVFICTTMYHEILEEMEQLLQSLHDIDVNFKRAGRYVESHIFFDGCIRAEVLNSYILQLASLVETTLKVKLSDVTKLVTPYGMQLRWKLPGGLPITIHLKDNNKVKNKKRWSQVMYMSYVLDYKQRVLNVRDDQTFILTTDADVNFTHESMEALLDYMMQDDQIGAVCGRTHPLGNGPMVWYQIFDYAIGHWFMKVANHVFGSVLCCPGCFSLYRCMAVRDILPTYSTTVSEAFEFLTKDMGEDRWMCTLMVQSGWRLAYCAAAEDETFCPQEFEEFYKQRRRWMPSTLANLGLLVSEWRVVLKNNENISFPFILYQVVLLVATLIGPSIVILFIVGGLVNMGMNEIVATVLLSSVTLMYASICLFFPQSTQINVAKFLTFVFAVIMIVVTIGLAQQISKELSERKDLKIAFIKSNRTLEIPINKQLPAGISTLYLGGLAGIFIIAAFMHPKEALCLLNGIWYLLCLPSGYLLLTVYSVVNMTDRSWGTREGKSGNKGKEQDPLSLLWDKCKKTCVCCLKPKSEPPAVSKERQPSVDESKTQRLIRAVSRKSKKKKLNGSFGSRKSRDRVNVKDQGSEFDSDAASEFQSTRIKEKLKKGSLGKLKLAIRDSLKGIGFRTRMPDPEPFQDRMPMGEMNHLQPGSPPYPAIHVTTIAVDGPIDYEDDNSFPFTEPIRHLYEQNYSSKDKGYIGNNLDHGFPPLPTSFPITNQYGNHDNQGYDRNTNDYQRSPGFPVNMNTKNQQRRGSHINEGYDPTTNWPSSPGYPNVVQNDLGRESPHSVSPPPENRQAPHIYEKIAPIQYPYPLTATAPSIERAKQVDKTIEVDSAYSSSQGSSQPYPNRIRRRSRDDSIASLDQKYGPGLLLPENQGLDELSYLGSMGGESSFLTLNREDQHMPVEDWLRGDLREYISKFKKHGYDTIAFICRMQEKDLENIGITKRGHRQKIFREIKRLPKNEIDEDIPNDVLEWLEDLGLAEYRNVFEDNGYTEPSDLEDLKSMEKDTVKETFKIEKVAHLNMLCQAIDKLQYANQGQKAIRNARKQLLRVSTHNLEDCYGDNGPEEYDFWENLRESRLTPESSAFDGNKELKEKLVDLRNTALMAFFVANTLWLIIIMVLVQQSSLKFLGVDIIGLSFLFVYGTIIILQFLAMIAHRLTTLLHVLARAPWVCCRPTNQKNENVDRT